MEKTRWPRIKRHTKTVKLFFVIVCVIASNSEMEKKSIFRRHHAPFSVAAWNLKKTTTHISGNIINFNIWHIALTDDGAIILWGAVLKLFLQRQTSKGLQCLSTSWYFKAPCFSILSQGQVKIQTLIQYVSKKLWFLSSPPHHLHAC